MKNSRWFKRSSMMMIGVLIVGLISQVMSVPPAKADAIENAVYTTAYITSFDSNVVDVVDLTDGTVQQAAIAVGSQPVSAAVNPNGTQVFVANSGDDTLSVIDPATNTITSTIAVGSSPQGMAFNEDGSLLYVANRISQNVSVVDTDTLTVVATIATTGVDPVDVLVVGDTLYVACKGSDTVDVVDLTSNTVTIQIDAMLPNGLSVNPAGTRVYVANENMRSVTIIDTSDNTTTTAILDFGGFSTIAPVSTEVSPDGSKVYVANYDGTVSVVDTTSQMVTATINVGTANAVVGVSQDGTRAYSLNVGDSSISVIDTSTDTVINTITGLSSNPNMTGSFMIATAIEAVTTPTVPSAPTYLTATAGDGEVALVWTESPHTVTYSVYQGTNANTYGPVAIATIPSSTTSYTATGLTNGTTYYFAVKASNSGGSSGYSNEASAAPVSSATYTVTYNGNGNTGGSVPTDTHDYAEGNSVTVAGNTGSLTKTGHTFAGWNTQEDGEGTSYAASAYFNIGTSDVTLYAVWTDNLYTVTFDSNGGSGVGAQPVLYNGMASEPTDPTRTGYTFAGWYSDSGLSTAYDFSTAVTGDATLYAKWQAVAPPAPPVPPAPVYAIMYDGNGSTEGSVPTDSHTYPQGATVTVADNTGKLTKKGYTFEGWNTQADGEGTTYAADSRLTMGSSHVTLYALWKSTSPIISTVVGTGVSGYAGDGDAAEKAKLNNSYAVAADDSGNLYIADTSNNRVRKIAADGTISTLAGIGTPGYSGDGGRADQARINNPSGVAVDSSGNVYIADRYNNRIRKVDQDGTISTVAGTGSASYSGDGGPADQAGINSPTGVAVDGSGNVYIADRYNNRIRKIDQDGTISTVAGTGRSGYSGDGGPADKAELYWPFSVALYDGELYIADYSNHRVRKVDADGIISTVAGTGSSGYSGDGGRAEDAQLANPSGVAFDGRGNLYISNYGSSAVNKITPDGKISTLAGTGASGYSGDLGPAEQAKINRPLGIAVDASGNVYIADTFNQRIRKVTLAAPTNPVTPAANLGTVTQSSENGQTTTTIVVNDQKLQNEIQSTPANGVITIQNQDSSDNLKAVLNGSSIQSMADKNQVLQVKTDTASYSLPASQVNLNEVSGELGTDQLSDMQVGVQISSPSQDQVNTLNQAAQSSGATLAAPPVEFSVTASSGGKTVEINKFNSYVERTITLPSGTDPSKLTTGVVLSDDGTIQHVPTTIKSDNGKYYAKINSLTNSTYAVISYSATFRDVEGHWAKRAVNHMGSLMILSGIGNHEFAPDKHTTRGEFAVMITRALGLKPAASGVSFKDVPSTAWYNGAIEMANSYHLMGGYEDGTFRPNETLTREQAMVILSRAMKLTGLGANVSASGAKETLQSFADVSDVSPWAMSEIASSVQAGVISGRTAAELAPQSFITRAEVAVMLERLLQKSGLIGE